MATAFTESTPQEVTQDRAVALCGILWVECSTRGRPAEDPEEMKS
jgi:hypothetical protein